jgi:hypothetical protein
MSFGRCRRRKKTLRDRKTGISAILRLEFFNPPSGRRSANEPASSGGKLLKLGAAFPVAITAFIFAASIAPLSIVGAAESASKTIKTVPGMPPVIDPNNLYSERPRLIQRTSFVAVDDISENRFHGRKNGGRNDTG